MSLGANGSLGSVGNAGSTGGGNTGGGNSGGNSPGGGTAGGGTSGQGPFNDAIKGIGPSKADSVPIPLIVLAGIAGLLLAAGAAGFAARRIHARRVPIQTRPPTPQDDPRQ
jgi:hypothetical protein